MNIPNIFDKNVSDQMLGRIKSLSKNNTAQWGKMDVAQMMAHLNVPFEYAFETTHKKPNAFFKFMLKTMVKGGVVNEKPYKRNSGTAPDFIIKGQRDFEVEKTRLISYFQNMTTQSRADFEGREYLPFGNMTATEWNNLFYKHIDHHLTQFGA